MIDVVIESHAVEESKAIATEEPRRKSYLHNQENS